MKITLAVASVVLVSGTSAAESNRAPLPPAYVEECGSCHVAFPGRMLDATSWRAVLGGLPQHFGVDASLDSQTLISIRGHLESSARSEPTATNGKPLLRITETRWFRDEHDEVPARLWQEPGALKPSDCTACHQGANAGSYAEREIRLPRKGETK